ncbi:hypothetical protein DXG03_006580 [Asterophora parasitica]|uniref:Uncharacterized protein n=1 Tax=Asterophora parasitica TaxID=117018 RepID=A0A9P7G851_9AGAR|nr:hypothetical protein DXG03_006580 [Asterophora parasitica]
MPPALYDRQRLIHDIVELDIRISQTLRSRLGHARWKRLNDVPITDSDVIQGRRNYERALETVLEPTCKDEQYPVLRELFIEEDSIEELIRTAEAGEFQTRDWYFMWAYLPENEREHYDGLISDLFRPFARLATRPLPIYSGMPPTGATPSRLPALPDGTVSQRPTSDSDVLTNRDALLRHPQSMGEQSGGRVPPSTVAVTPSPEKDAHPPTRLPLTENPSVSGYKRRRTLSPVPDKDPSHNPHPNDKRHKIDNLKALALSRIKGSSKENDASHAIRFKKEKRAASSLKDTGKKPPITSKTIVEGAMRGAQQQKVFQEQKAKEDEEAAKDAKRDRQAQAIIDEKARKRRPSKPNRRASIAGPKHFKEITAQTTSEAQQSRSSHSNPKSKKTPGHKWL